MPLRGRGEAPLHLSADPWVLATDTWEIAGGHRDAYLGNGWIGQRLGRTGTGIEPGTSAPVLLAGHYNRDDSLEGLPPVLPLQVSVAGRVFGADPRSLRRYRQELRLKEGLLHTEATWDGGAGEVGLVLDTAYLRPHLDLALLQVRVENRGRAPVRVGLAEQAVPGLSSTTTGHFAVKSGPIHYEGRLAVLEPDSLPADGAFAYQVPAGRTVRLALVTQVRGAPLPHAERAQKSEKRGEARTHAAQFADRSSPVGVTTGGLPVQAVTGDRVDEWFAEHRAAWRRLWAGDIEIEGDPEAQQIVRACLFWLRCSTCPENTAGAPPMGLSSQAFGGHVFGDTESWMFPALLPQQPQVARAQLEYRFRTLAGARENARADGLPGASYAWESGRTGREALRGGIFTQGRHVTGDVALALRQYYQATLDRNWLAQRAWPILEATAANWVARAKPDGSGGLQIPRVTTPDENAGLVDGSAWTHHVARRNLEFATEVARLLGKRADPAWGKTAWGLGFRRQPRSGLILAHSAFTEKSRAKQADALLLFHPGGLNLPAEEWGKLYDFYAPRVIPNGPAMTDAIHTIVAAYLGREDEAIRRFRGSYRPFVRPPFHVFSEKRTRDNLCFLTGAAGVIEAVLYGFAGLRLEPDPQHPNRPLVQPHLPRDWTALRLRGLHWRGKTWDVTLQPATAPDWKVASDAR